MNSRAVHSSAFVVAAFLLAIGALTAAAGFDLSSLEPARAVAPPRANADPPGFQAGSTTTVYITDQGPDPADITVEIGDTVTWINQTGETQTLEGTTGARVFLPLVLRGYSAGAAGVSPEYEEPASGTYGAGC